MSNDESPIFDLQFSMQTSLSPGDPNSHILKFEAAIMDLSLETGLPQSTIGHFDVWRFNIETYQKKDCGHLYDMFDAESEEVERLYTTLFDSTGSSRIELDIDGFAFADDILYFQWGHFPPDVRFSPVTLAAAERIIDCLGSGCAVTALWPWDKPEPDIKEESSEHVFAYIESQENHERHWGKIGFQRIQGTSILVRDMANNGYEIRKILDDGYPS